MGRALTGDSIYISDSLFYHQLLRFFHAHRTIGTKDTPFFVRSLLVVNYLHAGGDGEGDEAEGHDEPEEVLVADVLGDET